jgi:hypothetical protein
MMARWLKVTWPKSDPEELDLAVESGFGGLGTAYRSHGTTNYVRAYDEHADLLHRHLSDLAEQGARVGD